MSATGSPPKYWSCSTDRDRIELTFAIRGAVGGIALGVVLVAFFGYWVALFLHGWTLGGEEILIGGVIFWLVMLAGLLFGLYVLDRMLWAKTRYTLDQHTLTVNETSLFRNRVTEIDRARILAVVQVVTPPKEAGLSEIWATLVRYRSPADDRRHDLALDGYSEEESKWLAPIVATWAGVATHGERTDDDEGQDA